MEAVVTVGIQPRPVGTPWVLLQFNTAICGFVIGFPPDQAEQMATTLPEGLRNAIRECKQAENGIYVPPGAQGNGLIVPNQEGFPRG